MISFKISQVSTSITLVRLKGQLDESSREYFFDCVGGALFGRAKTVVIDLSGVGAISTGGLETLAETEQQTRRSGGRIFLTHVNSKIADILSQTQLSRLSLIHPSTEELIKRLNSKEPALPQCA